MKFEEKLKYSIKSNDIRKINEVFEEIYYEYGHLIGFIISQYVYNKQDVEELINDVFINFFNNINFIKMKNIKSYLSKIAKNKAINFAKKHNNYILDDNYIQKTSSNDKVLFYFIIDDMKKILSDKEIKIIVNHIIYDRSFKEIAFNLKKPVSTISDQYYNAIEKLKKGDKKWI